MPDISVLMIDDEAAILKAVSTTLKRENMKVTCASHAAQALDILAKNEFDVILLDVIMPGQDGFELLHEIRSLQIFTPVILVSGRGEDSVQIKGLELGADDYITKPFSKAVLTSKIQAIVRRKNQYAAPSPSIQTPIQKGAFTLFMDSQTVQKDGREISLSSKEFALLCLFIENPEHVFTKQELFAKVWKSDGSDDNTILVYIKKLRSKIENNPSAPVHIQTVWGKGYQFCL